MVLSHGDKNMGARKFVSRLLVSTALVGVAAVALSTGATLITAASAQTWNGGSGNWSNAGSWTPATVPNATDATATFNSVAGAPVVSLGGGTFSIGTLNINGDGNAADRYSLQNGTLVMSATGTAAINVTNSPLNGNDLASNLTLQLNSPTLITADASSRYIINGAITGTGQLQIAGAGQIILGNNVVAQPNTYSGGTLINTGGTLVVGLADGSGSLGSGAIVNNGTLTFDTAATSVISSGMAMSGSGTFQVTGTSTLQAGADNVFSSGGTYNLQTGNATLDLNSHSGAIGALTGVNGSTVSLGSGTLTIGGNGVVSGYFGTITGTGGITKVGTEVLELRSATTYQGPTVVQGGLATIFATTASTSFTAEQDGHLRIFSANLVPTASSFSATGNGILEFNGSNQIGALNGTANTQLVMASGSTLTVGTGSAGGTFSGAIGPDGNGALTKIGAGALTLSGANLYSGGTTISAGTIIAGSSSALGTGAVDVAGGTLDLNGQNLSIGSLSGSAGSVTSNSASASTLTVDQTANGVLAGSIIQPGGSGSIAFVKNGAATLTLTGANSYAGGTTVNAGRLNADSALALGASTGALTVNGGVLDVVGHSFTIGSLSGTGGTITNSAVGLNTITTNQAVDTSYAGVIEDGAGQIGLTKTGAGTLTLTNANTYTGATTIDGGKLLVNGSLANTAVAVNSGGTLGGSGTIGGAVTVNGGGTIAAGNSPGTLTVGSLTLISGSNSVFELNTPDKIGGGSAATDNDLIKVTGALNINAGAQLQVTAASAGYYQLFQYGSLTGNFANGNISGTIAASPLVALPGLPSASTYIDATANALNITLLGPGQTIHFWDGADGIANGTVSGGTGTWNATNTNWTSSPTNTVGGASSNAVNGPYSDPAGTAVPGLVAVFGTTGGTVTVAGTQYFDTLQFNVGGYTLTGGTLAIQAATGTTGIVNTGGNTVTINSAIADGSGNRLQKVGGGTLILGSTNTYTGGTDLQAGTIQVTTGGALGTGALDMASGTTLQAGASVTLPNAITLAAGSETIDNGGNTFTLNGTISGAGALTVQGAGAVVITNADSAGGLTTVASGTLQVTGTGSIASGAQVNGGATLTNAGTVNGGVTNAGTVVTTNTITGGVTNTGSFTAQGTVNGAIANNAGTFAVSGNLSSDSTFTNANGATLNVNTGTYTIGGLLTNSGSLTVAGGAALTDNAGITNTASGVIVNNGTITDDFVNAGTATNNGTWNANATNSGTLTNNGTWNGAINNSGVFTNSSAATLNGNLTNTGSVNGAGTINGNVANNGGTFTVTGGNLQLNGGFTNASGATLAVSGGNASMTGALASSGTINVSAARTLSALGGVTNNAGGSITNGGTISGGITNNGTLGTTGIINGGLINGGSVTASGAINDGITNNSLLTVSGPLTTNGTVANNGTIALTNGADFTGITTLNNAGTINVSGSRTLGVGTLNNLGSGFISLINGSTADRLTVTGNYVGSGGSRLGVDASLTTVASADAVTVNGTAGGSTTIVVNLPNTLRQAFANPVTVLSVANGSAPNLGIQTVSNTGTSAVTPVNGPVTSFLQSGFVNYALRQVQNGNRIDYQIISSFNSAPAASVASSVSGVITGVAAGFHQAASAIVSRPDDCKPNQLMGGPFIRTSGGDGKVNLNGTTSGGGLNSSSATGTNSTFFGFQTGADIGVCNINGTGWNINTGVFGGGVHADATAASSSTIGGGVLTKAKLDVPFAGAYAFVSKDAFTFELNYRHDFYDARITTPDPASGGFFVNPGTKMKGDGNTLTASAGYKIPIYEAWYIEPQVGISKSFVDFGYLNLGQTGLDYLKFGTIRSLLGRAGANIGTAFQVNDKLIVAPFVTASIWREFGPPTKAVAVLDTIGSRFDVKTERVGTFGQAGGGIQFKLLDSGFLGFVRGDVRFGDKINGKALNAGLRYQF